MATFFHSIFGRPRDEAQQEGDVQLVEQVKRQVEGVRRTVLYDGDVGLYQRWYFELRLKEEVQRADRYGLSFAIVLIRLADSEYTAAEEVWQRRAAAAAYATSKAVRNVDLTATVGVGEFAICLVHCNRDGVNSALERLGDALRDFPCRFGTIVYPDDHLDAKGLIELARSRSQNYF